MSTTLLSRLDILLTANASGFREEMQGAAEESNSSFDKIKNGAKAMAGVLAGAFAVGAIGVWIDETINAAIELDNLAKAVGTNAQDLQRWQSVAKKSAVEVEAVADAMSTLNEKILEQATGGDTFLKGLGIDAVDAAGNLKTAEDALIEISGAFSEMSDGAAKSAIAADLMGDAGMKLIPVLNQGTDAISGQLQAADKLGTMLEAHTIKQMRQFKTDMAQTGQAVDALKTSVLVQLMPSLANLSGMLAESAKKSDAVRVAVAGVEVVFKVLASVAAVVGGVFSVVGRTIGKLGAAVYQFVSMNFKGAWETISDGGIPFFAELQQVGNELGGTLTRIWAGVDKSAASAIQNLSTAKDLAVVTNIAAMNAGDAAATAPKPAATPKPAAKPAVKPQPPIKDASAEFDKMLDYRVPVVAADPSDEIVQRYRAMAEQIKQDQKVLTIDLIAIDHDRLASVKQTIADQSIFTRLLFKSDNDAKLSDAQKIFDQETSLSAQRLEALNFELQEKIRLVNAAEMVMVDGADEANRLREALTAEHHARVVEMESGKVDALRRGWDTAKQYWAQSLQAMGAESSKAAKLSREIGKVQALQDLYSRTRTAAMGAKSALSIIPIVGPALGQAAYLGTMAMGAFQAKQIISGSGDLGAGGTVPTASGVGSIVPTADQPQNQVEPQPRTTIAIPADNIFIGRQLVELMNDAIGDGKGLNVPQFVAV